MPKTRIPAKHAKYQTNSRLRMLKLEQRILFDGAAAVEVVAAQDNPVPDSAPRPSPSVADAPASTANPADAPPSLVDVATAQDSLAVTTPEVASTPADAGAIPAAVATAQDQARRLVAEFLQQPDLEQKLFALFNGGQTSPSAEWSQAADTYVASLRAGDTSLRVELRSSTEMQGALGAYAATGPDGGQVIYLNRDFVLAGASTEAITRVLIEETGHAIDARLNPTTDTAGDEGQRFAATVLGADTSGQGFASDNDHFQLLIDDHLVNVEADTNPSITIPDGQLLNFASGALITGTDKAVGAVYKYTNVVTIGGTQIDAYVRIAGISNAVIATIDNGLGSTNYTLTNPDGTTQSIAGSSLFAPEIRTTAANGRVDFAIDFKDINGNALSLINFYNNSIDIDGREFVEYGGFQSYELASPTDLVATAGSGDQIRFAQSGSGNYNGLILNNPGRVQTKFDSVTTLTISMGSSQVEASARQYGSIFASSKFAASVVVTAPSVNTLATSDSTPLITGTVGNTVLGGTEPFTVTVNGTTYTKGASPELVVTGLTWSLQAPTLPNGTYDVTAKRGTVLVDQTSGELTVDTVQPTATIVMADTALRIGETSQVTITFSEAVTNFANADVTVQNGTLSALSSANGGVTWTGTFTPTTAITDTTNVITLANTYTDLAGNTGTTATSANYAIDTQAPAIAAQTFSYGENISTGTSIGIVAASDAGGVSGFSFTATGTQTSADGFYQIDNTGRISLTVAGAASAVNNFEAGSNTGAYGITVSDAAGNSNTATVTLNETDRNDAPVNALPAGLTINEDTPVKLAGLSVTDADAASGTITVTLAVGSGTLTAANSGGVTIAGSGSGSLVLSGTLASINAYLATPASQPLFVPVANASGAVSLTMTTSDGGNTGPGGAQTDSDNISINVTPVADAPLLKTYAVSTNLDEQNVSGWGFVPVTSLNGGVWRTDNASGNVEIGDASTYLGGSSTNQVIELEAAAGDASNLYTTMPVKDGEIYTLSFDYAMRTGQTPANSTFSVFWNGQKVAELAPSTTALTNYTVDLLSGITGTGKLELRANDKSSVGAVLDNVSLAFKGASGFEDQPINLPSITTGLVDTDGSETLAVSVSSIPAGAVLTDGTNSFTASAGSTSASVTGWNLSTLRITPPADFNGNFQLTVTATATEQANGDARSSTSNINVRVIPVNDAPTTSAVTLAAIAEDSGTRIITTAQLLGNAADIEANTLAVSNVSIATGSGTLVNNGNGTWSYTPALNDDTSVSFSYTITDNGTTNGVADPKSVAGSATLDITPVNDAPVAVDDAVNATEDTAFTSAIDLDANDTDVDGNALTVTPGTFTTAQGGTIVIAANGSYTYTPAANFNGTDTVNYTVTDGTLTDVGQLTITVAAVNDAPVAVDDAVNATEDTAFTSAIDLDANDTDVDGNALTVTPGTFTTAQGGTIVIAANGSYTYTPAANFNGTDTVNYTVTDGTLTDVGQLTITVAAVNDAPVAVDDAVNATEDTAFTSAIDLDANDTDVDGNALTVTPGTFTTAQGGTIVIAANGSYTYTPAANFNGTDTVNYTVTDGTLTDVGQLTITVAAVNDAPVAVDDAVNATEDTAFTSAIDLDANDTDVDGNALTVTPGTFTTAQGGTIVIAANGSYTYTPAANFNGTDTVNYTVTDGTLTDVGQLTITVAAVNDAPVAVDDAVNATEDTAFTSAIDLDANDTDVDGNALTVTPGTFTTAQGGTIVIAANGSYTYTPAANFNGTDTVNYTVTDGTLTDVGQLTITVAAVNDAPVAVDDAVNATEDTAFTSAIDLDANDTDVDGNALTVTPGTFTTAQGGTIVIAANGSYTYTPAANFNGTDTVNYTVTDGTLTDVGQLTITVAAVNDAPVAVDDAVNATEDTAFTSAIDLDANDTDVDGNALTVTPGTFTTAQGGTIVIAANGSYTYTPAANFNGTDTVNYTVTDGTLTDVGQLTITVAAVNDAPDIADATVTLNENIAPGTPVTNVSDSFTGTDFDRDGQAITYSITGGNASGIFVIDPVTGAITIAAGKALNYETASQHVLTVRASDGTLSDTAQITVNVADLDDTAPTATIVVADTSLTAGETSQVTITFSEAVTGFTNADLAIENGTLSNVSSSDGGKTWTATFTPTANITDTTNVITLANTGVTDAAGNAGTGSTASNNYAIDTLRPGIAITSDKATLRAGETATLTFTLSEPVADFAAGDISVSGGTLSNFTGSGIRYTATFTPTASSASTGVISVASNLFTDAAGNANNDGADADNRVTMVVDTVLAQPNSPANYQQLAPTTVSFTPHAESFQPANHVLAAVADGVEQVNRTGEFSPDTSRTSPIMASLSTDTALHVLRAVRAVGSDVRAVANTIASITANSLSADARNSLLGVGTAEGGADRALGGTDGAPAPAATPDGAETAESAETQTAPLADAAQDSPDAQAVESQPVARTNFSEQLRLAAENRRLSPASQRRSA